AQESSLSERLLSYLAGCFSAHDAPKTPHCCCLFLIWCPIVLFRANLDMSLLETRTHRWLYVLTTSISEFAKGYRTVSCGLSIHGYISNRLRRNGNNQRTHQAVVLTE